VKSCPQPAAPRAGSLSPAASAGAGTASLKGCQGLAGHPPKGRKEREERGGMGEKLKNNHKENKLFFEIGNFKEKIYEPLGL